MSLLRPACFWLLALLSLAAIWRAPAAADPALQQLAEVQRAVAALPSRSDRDRFGRIEYWQSADATGGDCEDKALAARDALIALGWAPERLRLALAWDETGSWHATLTVDLGQGAEATTWVLDNRFAEPQTWSALAARGYRWSLRQSAGRGWQRVGG